LIGLGVLASLHSHHCSHRSRQFTADALSRRDPTGTTKIRQRFERELVRRFERLKRLIREAIVDLDVLGLKEQPTLAQQLGTALFTQAYQQPQLRDAVPALAREAFKFNRSGQKVTGFMNWLYEAQADGILGVTLGTPNALASQQAWSNVYIDTAYQKGIRDAAREMGSGGVDLPSGFVSGGLNRPVHADRVGLIYTRTYNELEGITDTMASQISRVLAQGIAEGRGVQDIARRLANRVDKIGIERARVLARTEVIAAHAQATINSYKEMEIEGVTVRAEWATAGDDAVCPQCEDLEGQVFTIEQAEGMIPLHPNCRCAFLPVIEDAPVRDARDAGWEEQPRVPAGSPEGGQWASREGGVGSGGGERSVPLDAASTAAAQELGLGTGYRGTDAPARMQSMAVDNPLPKTDVLSYDQVQEMPTSLLSLPGTMREVPIDSLESVQDYVFPQRVAQYNDPKSFGLVRYPVLTATVNGKNVILDGTHRAVADKLKGSKTIETKHIGSYSVQGNIWTAV
jgi:SPP1 gp7 family putative phage head morphogenesis protein